MTKQEIVDFLSQEENFMLGREVADEILAAHGFVAFLWGVEDIRSVKGGQNLTDEQCMEILDKIQSKHDASILVTHIISYYVFDYVSDEDYENDKRDEDDDDI